MTTNTKERIDSYEVEHFYIRALALKSMGIQFVCWEIVGWVLIISHYFTSTWPAMLMQLSQQEVFGRVRNPSSRC